VTANPASGRRRGCPESLLGPRVIGICPLLDDDTCWFLALDFDKSTWQDKVCDLVADHWHIQVDQCHNVPAVSFEGVLREGRSIAE
jgi:hypothetical protein